MRKRWLTLSFLIFLFLLFPALSGHAYAIPWTEIDPGLDQSQAAQLAPGSALTDEPSDYSELCLNRPCGYMSVFSSMNDKEAQDAAPLTASAPVPEPASLVLMGCGIAGLGLLWRRKHQGP